MIFHDLYCRGCGREKRNEEIRGGVFPACCGEPMRWRPFMFHTDVFGVPKFSVAAGKDVSSSRDREKKMKEHGFVPCGDPIGGSRNESHLHLGRSTSYPGQRVRKTLTKERGIST